ncbi:MAG: hypothetical protein V4613_02450 [Bacteroidota bacterium]
MKHLLTILIGLFWSVSLLADCRGTGLWIFPSGPTIKQNSIFILDGYAESQGIILNLNKKNNIYLKNGNKKIKLNVIEICVGQFYLTQAVLKPEKELEVGLEYTMHIDSLPEYESFDKYNKITQKYEPVTYTVVAGRDTIKPILTGIPKELKKTLIHYGCGPSIHVVFSNPATDSSDLIVKTTVKNLKTGLETTYYISIGGDNVCVGHGMCSGAFDFDDSDNYEVEFSFMDSSGNLTPWTGDRIKFTKPIKANQPQR